MKQSLLLTMLLALGCGGAKREAATPVESGSTPTASGPKKEVFRNGDTVVYELGADAYEVVAPGEQAGVEAEYSFLETLRCGGDGRWKLKSQGLVHEKGRAYDKLDVVCTVGGETKVFSFDITSFFGKL